MEITIVEKAIMRPNCCARCRTAKSSYFADFHVSWAGENLYLCAECHARSAMLLDVVPVTKYQEVLTELADKKQRVDEMRVREHEACARATAAESRLENIEPEFKDAQQSRHRLERELKKLTKQLEQAKAGITTFEDIRDAFSAVAQNGHGEVPEEVAA